MASRITDLEQKLETGKNTSVFPSQILLENYCSADVDRAEVDVSETSSFDGQSPTDDVIKIEKSVDVCEKGSDAMTLPPQLQLLVDKAMKELEIDNDNN